jgi:tRNA G10  N-methylase Trm11
MDLGTEAVLSHGSDLERQALTGMHRLFRYPAKFHGPLARALLEEYAEPGSRVIDPFCGSGTLMIEASLVGRHVNGADLDPLAAFVADVKCQPYDLQQLEASYKWVPLFNRREVDPISG